MRLSTKLILTIATAARLLTASNAKAAEERALALEYVLQQVTYLPGDRAIADVIDYAPTQVECAAMLGTMPPPVRTAGAIVAFECVPDEQAIDAEFRL